MRPRQSPSLDGFVASLPRHDGATAALPSPCSPLRRRRRSISGGTAQPLDGGLAVWPEAPRPSSRGSEATKRSRRGRCNPPVWVASSLRSLAMTELIAATAALPSPCSPSRQPAARGASRALTAPRGAGCRPPCPFGEQSGPRPRSFTKRTWMQNAAPTSRGHPEGTVASAEERRSRLTAARRRGRRRRGRHREGDLLPQPRRCHRRARRQGNPLRGALRAP
jgi:hypothetical protein